MGDIIGMPSEDDLFVDFFSQMNSTVNIKQGQRTTNCQEKIRPSKTRRRKYKIKLSGTMLTITVILFGYLIFERNFDR